MFTARTGQQGGDEGACWRVDLAPGISAAGCEESRACVCADWELDLVRGPQHQSITVAVIPEEERAARRLPASGASSA